MADGRTDPDPDPDPDPDSRVDSRRTRGFAISGSAGYSNQQQKQKQKLRPRPTTQPHTHASKISRWQICAPRHKQSNGQSSTDPSTSLQLSSHHYVYINSRIDSPRPFWLSLVIETQELRIFPVAVISFRGALGLTEVTS